MQLDLLPVLNLETCCSAGASCFDSVWLIVDMMVCGLGCSCSGTGFLGLSSDCCTALGMAAFDIAAYSLGSTDFALDLGVSFLVDIDLGACIP